VCLLCFDLILVFTKKTNNEKRKNNKFKQSVKKKKETKRFDFKKTN